MSLPRLLEIKPRAEWKLWVRYSDGTEGVADLSHLAGKGVFTIWEDPAEFRKARLDESGAIVWGDGIDVCPDSIYFRISGRDPAQYFAEHKAVNA